MKNQLTGEAYGYRYTIENHPQGGVIWALFYGSAEFKGAKADNTDAALTALRSAARAEMEG